MLNALILLAPLLYVVLSMALISGHPSDSESSTAMAKRVDAVYETMTEYRYLPVAVNVPAMTLNQASFPQATQGPAFQSALPPTKDSIANSMPVQPVLSMNRGPLPISPYEPGYHREEQTIPWLSHLGVINSVSGPAASQVLAPSGVPSIHVFDHLLKPMEPPSASYIPSASSPLPTHVSFAPSPIAASIPASIASLIDSLPAASVTAASPIPAQIPAPQQAPASSIAPVANPPTAASSSAASVESASNPGPLALPTHASAASPVPTLVPTPAPALASGSMQAPPQTLEQTPTPTSAISFAPSLPRDTPLASAHSGPSSEYPSTDIPFLQPTGPLSTRPSLTISSEAPSSSVVSRTQSTLNAHSPERTSATTSDSSRTSLAIPEVTSSISTLGDITETFTSTTTTTTTVTGRATMSPTSHSCSSVVHLKMSRMKCWQSLLSMMGLIYILALCLE